MPSRWLAFDRIRALTRQHNIYQHERVFQDQSQLERIAAGGELLNPSGQASILNQTNLQLHRLERYRDYEQMDTTGEIQLALDLYADEASLVDPERKHTLIIRARSRRLKRELEDLFFNTLQWDNQCRPTTRYLCKFGDCPFEIVPDRNRGGVSSLRHMSVYNFTRVETKHGDLVGFFYQDELETSTPIFLHPWQVMHLRLTSFENIYHPYGRAVIDGGRKAFKQLRLMEDAALIYRITRAPERRKFTIPVGLIPPKEVPGYMQMISNTFKRQRFYNPGTGTFDERYSPMIQEDDIFLPRRPDGSGPDVDVMPGAENLDQIKDIEYFKKKMIAPMKIPFSRVGIGDSAGEGSDKSLSQSSSEFAKAVQWVQREEITGLTKVAIVHLAMRGYKVEEMKGFELAMSATSAMEELYRIETWQTRVGVMLELKELGWFPKEWIITHFTDLTPDEIEELKEMEAIEAAGGEGNLGGGEDGGGGGVGGGLGGGDLGGDPNDPLAGAEGDPAAGDAGGDGGGGDAAADLDLGGGQVEESGWDRKAQLLVLSEMRELRRRGNRRAMAECVRRLSDRLGRQPGERRPICNQFQYQLESKELDGLSAIRDGAPVTLVESSVPRDEAASAIGEVRELIVGDVPAAEFDEGITAGDLPVFSEISDL